MGEEPTQIEGAYFGAMNITPQKRAVPDTLGGAPDRWRDWREDVAEYFDNTKAGMREVLMKTHEQDDAPTLDHICN